MTKSPNSKPYDLEDRTARFAKGVRELIKQIKKTIGNIEDGKQVIRSSGSVGANYIEANEALSKKDFAHRVKISRKEARESEYWLRLLDIQNVNNLKKEQEGLIGESVELIKIFSAIINKTR